MAQVLVDTSALVAFFVKSEKHHLAVKRYIFEHPNLKWLILSSVFDETVTWFRMKVSVEASISIGYLLREEHTYIVLSEADDLKVWETFCHYDDKSWSYTDCSLLVMAQQLGIREIISFNRHIRQIAGLGIICVPEG
jgi:uncharacterized protein